MTDTSPLLFPLDIIRAAGLRPVLIDGLGADALLIEEQRLILIDAGLTLHQLGEIAAQCLAEAVAQVDLLLAG